MRVITLKFIILKTGSSLKLLFLFKMLFRIISVFFVLLLALGRITPQINQKIPNYCDNFTLAYSSNTESE